MSKQTPTTQTVAAQMKTVKECCDKAPEGKKREAAMQHYQAAEKAQQQHNPAKATRELDAATLALK